MRKILFTALFIASIGTAADAQTSTDTASQTAATPAASAQADPSGAPKKKVKHVYTSEDFKAADPKDTAPQSSASASDSAANASDSKDDKSGKGTKKAAKKADPDAVAAQQAKVDNLKQQVDGETHVVADIQRLIDQEPSRASSMGAGLAKQQSDLTDLKKQLDSAQSQLDTMKNPK
jgi:hypothetical protein